MVNINFKRNKPGGKIRGRVFRHTDPGWRVDEDKLKLDRLKLRGFDRGEKEDVEQQMQAIGAVEEERRDVLQSVYFIPNLTHDAQTKAFGEIGEVLIERELGDILTKTEDLFTITNAELYKRVVLTNFFDFISKTSNNKFIVEIKRKKEDLKTGNAYQFSNMTKLIKWAYDKIRPHNPILTSNLTKADIDMRDVIPQRYSAYDFYLILLTPSQIYYHKFDKGKVFDYIKSNNQIRNNKRLAYRNSPLIQDFNHLTINQLANMRWLIRYTELIPFTKERFMNATRIAPSIEETKEDIEEEDGDIGDIDTEDEEDDEDQQHPASMVDVMDSASQEINEKARIERERRRLVREEGRRQKQSQKDKAKNIQKQEKKKEDEIFIQENVALVIFEHLTNMANEIFNIPRRTIGFYNQQRHKLTDKGLLVLLTVLQNFEITKGDLLQTAQIAFEDIVRGRKNATTRIKKHKIALFQPGFPE